MQGLRMLIASTEKTGNTWLKLLLAHVYDLPTPYLKQEFSPVEADHLGARWIAHEHFLPERPLLNWASQNQLVVLTTIRHPADVLVSLYHYCCNYASHYRDDRPIARALAADAAARAASAPEPNRLIDGELIRALQDRLISDLNISISWIRSRRSILVRYENLQLDPVETLRDLCAQVAPASDEQIRDAVTRCRLDLLRTRFEAEPHFFRRGLVGEWRTALPKDVQRRFCDEEPFRSQLAFLGYEADLPRPEPESLSVRPIDSLVEADGYFDNGVFFSSVFWRLLASSEDRRGREAVFQTAPADSFYHWLNAAADEDPLGDEGVPMVTNLGAFIHRIRPDLQAAYPDIFEEQRLSYAVWFLRYAGPAYQLDRSFLTPVALSWVVSRNP